MNSHKWALSIALLGALILAACQPVMPVETGELEDVSAALPDIPGEILITAGPFQMGCDVDNQNEICFGSEKPLHTVYLDAYYIDEFEVTNSRYLACVEAGVCEPPAQTLSLTRSDYFGNPDFADYPVIYMNWSQAHDFCEWKGKRLPTEAEWMKAARGTKDTRKFPWGDDAPTCELTNGGCGGDTSAVGSFPAGASPYGVMDMAGNVAEWVNDWYAADYYSVSPSENPQGPDSGEKRMYLGGTFDHTSRYMAIFNRSSDDADGAYRDLGFRCAHSP